MRKNHLEESESSCDLVRQREEHWGNEKYILKSHVSPLSQHNFFQLLWKANRDSKGEFFSLSAKADVTIGRLCVKSLPKSH